MPSSHYNSPPAWRDPAKRESDNLSAPLIATVCVTTFNQQPYIRKCLESIVMQETDFPFEVIVHDDCSTDGTKEIVQEFAERYPELIIPIIQEENQHSKGIRIRATYLWPRVRGEYIALCEGDDYWLVKDKLQKQVSFLASNPDYSLCHTENDYDQTITGVYIKGQAVNTISQFADESSLAVPILNRDYPIESCSVCFRSRYLSVILPKHAEDFSRKYKMGDTQLWFHLARLGKVKFFPESMVVYRKVPGSATAADNPRKSYEFVKNGYMMKCELAQRHGLNDALPQIHLKYARALARHAELNDDREGIINYAAILQSWGGKLSSDEKLRALAARNKLTFWFWIQLKQAKSLLKTKLKPKN